MEILLMLVPYKSRIPIRITDLKKKEVPKLMGPPFQK